MPSKRGLTIYHLLTDSTKAESQNLRGTDNEGVRAYPAPIPCFAASRLNKLIPGRRSASCRAHGKRSPVVNPVYKLREHTRFKWN